MRLVIDSIPPSNNKFIGRTNTWEYQEQKQIWEMLIYASAHMQKPKNPYDKAVVTIHYKFKDKRRRDPDNYSGKMILDGLTKSGVIADDSFSNIKLILEAEFGCGHPQTIITVEEVTELNDDCVFSFIGKVDDKEYYECSKCYTEHSDASAKYCSCCGRKIVGWFE